jgi:hypothetical protein
MAEGAQEALSDSQLDRDIESAVGIEPSAEFLARVRTRIAAEPQPSGWRLADVVSAFRRTSVEPLWAVAIVGIVLAIVVPQFMREETDRREVARIIPDAAGVPGAAVATPPAEARGNPGRPGEVRRDRAQRPVVAAADDRDGLRRSRFDDLILIAPGEQEAFDRLLAVVNDQTIELIAPVLESTRAGVDVIDAAVPVPLRTAEEGVNE